MAILRKSLSFLRKITRNEDLREGFAAHEVMPLAKGAKFAKENKPQK